MAIARKDLKGRALRKGESQRKGDGRYMYVFTDPLGKRKYVYAHTLKDLREKEDTLKKDQLDRPLRRTLSKRLESVLFSVMVSP